MGAQESFIAEVFIDESSQNNHANFIMGGIIVPIESVGPLTDCLVATRLPELPQGEMKWERVSKAKLPAYIRYVDAFFDCEFKNEIHFHALVVPTAKLNHTRFNSGSREIGFNKELFQLAMKFGRLYANRFHIYPDQRTTSQKPEELRLILNRAINLKEPKRDWPFRRVQFRDSSRTPILQLTDIMSGGIAYALNGHDKKPDASPAKCALSAHIMMRAGIKDITRDTAIKGKFTVWHRQLR